MPINFDLASIPGNSLLQAFPNTMDLEEFSIGGLHTNSSPAMARNALVSGKPEIGPIMMTKLIDCASPKLWDALAKGQVIKTGKAVATGNTTGPAATLVTYQFTDLRIVSINHHIDMRVLGKVEEIVTLSFKKLTIEVPGLNGAPQVVFEYDQVLGK